METLQHEIEQCSGDPAEAPESGDFGDQLDFYNQFIADDFVANSRNPAMFPLAGRLPYSLSDDILQLEHSYVLTGPVATILATYKAQTYSGMVIYSVQLKVRPNFFL
jgi:hypothetical protein